MTDKEDNVTNMRGIIGLANLGNTCYMNSAIQAFRHCPEWTLFCSQGKHEEYITDKESKPTTTLLAYQDLVRALWGGTGPAYVGPLGFYTELKKAVHDTIYDVFVQRSPQDSHEFLMWLLDQMYMATQKSLKLAPINEENPLMSGQAIQAWNRAFHQYSPLTDLIFGLMRIQYKCHGCSALHTRWDTFNSIKVPLGKNSDGEPWTLSQCIQHEFHEEEIEGYECDACKKKCTVTKTPSLWRLPKVFIVTLRRFTPMGTRDNSMFKYSGEPMTFTDSFSSESNEQTRTKSYKVFGTVDHHGNHMGGHYTSQCFNPVWKVWHRYDDENAIQIEAPAFGVHTYMLLFR